MSFFSVYINSSYHNVIESLKLNHNSMIKKYAKILPITSTNVWRCDPKPHHYEEGLYRNKV